jgi:hypothetical protein
MAASPSRKAVTTSWGVSLASPGHFMSAPLKDPAAVSRRSSCCLIASLSPYPLIFIGCLRETPRSPR